MAELTPEQLLLKDSVERWFQAHATTHAKMRASWDRGAWLQLATDLGILAAPFAEALGGMGGGALETLLIMEASGKHLAVHPYLQTIAMTGRLIAAQPDLNATLLSGIISGKRIVAPAWREEQSRDCAADVRVSATIDSSGSGLLNGCKIMVEAAPWASDLLVSARTRGAGRDRDGISLFLLPVDRAGITLSPAHTIDGHACATVRFDRVYISEADRLGPLHNALPLIEGMLDEGAAALCAEAVGLMRAMLEQTTIYARQRKQFGVSIASFQALQHRMVDMLLQQEHAASLAEAAARAIDLDLPERRLIIAAAKHIIGRALEVVGTGAVQIHGGIGIMDETPVTRCFRRALVIQRQCGDAAHHLGQCAAQAGWTLPTASNTREFTDTLSRLGGASHDDLASVAVFRDEVRRFLREEFTAGLRNAATWETSAFATPAAADEWHRRLARKGWSAPSWPQKHGGPGWTARQRQVFETEMAMAGAPRLPGMGVGMAAPVIMRFGTDEQQAFFLPRILSGEMRWCQGFSEPNAGSDLASLQMKAVRDGDHYLLDGSKLWTTFAHHADWMFVLVRTASEGKPQAGITFLLLPMSTPGLTVRPLISMSGDHDVNQVFFDHVRVPVANRLGEENAGWHVAKYLLEFERGVGHQVPALVAELARVREIAERENGDDGQPLWQCDDFRRRFAELEIRTLALRLTEERLIYSLPAGKNVGDTTAALMKLGWSETAQAIDSLALDALGAQAAVDQHAAFAARDASRVVGPPWSATPMRRYLNDRVMTVAGGSSEVLRNILARAVLNLR
jgi:alkylation response protein AidB-like acyl-CoA dehydrogenase